MSELSKDTVIKVRNLVKRFVISKHKPMDLKSLVTHLITGKFFSWDKQEISVLEGISFDVKKGEFLGIMGKNGVGKTTLLRLLAGVYEATSGSITSTGRIAPLISLGAGFNPELTGIENIYLNAAILGFSRQQVNEKLDTILEFSELGEKVKLPIKMFSSGMVVRLGFSIAAHLDADILLLDEILGVGDVGFARKSVRKIKDLNKEGKTIVLVNHSPKTVATYCTRCLILSKGEVLFDGDPDEGAIKYEDTFPK